MRLSLITDGITPYVIGGMQRHSFFIAKYFAASGIHVDLYHYSESNKYDINLLEFFTEEEKNNIESIVLEFPQHDLMPGHYLKSSYQYATMIYNELTTREKSDFIYAKGFTAWELLKKKSCGMILPPVGVNFHGFEMFQKPPSFRSRIEQMLLRPAVKYNVLNADYVFSYGGKITDIIKSLGVPMSKIIEAHSGVEKEMIRDKHNIKVEDKRKFVFVGRYERRKGIKELISAIKSINNQERCEFHFIGAIPLKQQITATNVFFYGKVTDKMKLTSILDVCDVLICPSHSEGMPNVILEGMARGLAIIATDVGAVSLMVSSKNGWLINSPTTSAIVKAIREAISCDNEKLLNCKINSLNKITEKFNWKSISYNLINTIKQSIKN